MQESGDQNSPSAFSPSAYTKGIHAPEQVSMSLLLTLYISWVTEITLFLACCLTVHRGLLLMAQ